MYGRVSFYSSVCRGNVHVACCFIVFKAFNFSLKCLTVKLLLFLLSGLLSPDKKTEGFFFLLKLDTCP